MNSDEKKHSMDLWGGIICVVLGVFIWWFSRQPIYNPEPGETQFAILFGWVVLIILCAFGTGLICKWMKHRNKNNG